MKRNGIHRFAGDACVLVFLADLSQFDDKRGQLQRNINLLQTIMNYEWFKKTPIVLFLVKKDELVAKIKSGIIVSSYFQEYQGNKDLNFPPFSFYTQSLLIKNGPRVINLTSVSCFVLLIPLGHFV